jgi:hypothetical protein
MRFVFVIILYHQTKRIKKQMLFLFKNKMYSVIYSNRLNEKYAIKYKERNEKLIIKSISRRKNMCVFFFLNL